MNALKDGQREIFGEKDMLRERDRETKVLKLDFLLKRQSVSSGNRGFFIYFFN